MLRLQLVLRRLQLRLQFFLRLLVLRQFNRKGVMPLTGFGDLLFGRRQSPPFVGHVLRQALNL